METAAAACQNSFPQTHTSEAAISLDGFLLRILYGYFFLLAAYGKDFSYLKVQLGPLPLFVGEIALAIALTWSLLRFKNGQLRLGRGFLLSLGLFFAWGMIRLLISLPGARDFGLVQVIRDSALFYQALWIFAGAALTAAESMTFLRTILLGAAVSEYCIWLVPHLQYLVPTLQTPALASVLLPAGNEVVSPLFPLALVAWGTPAPQAAIGISYGRYLLSQFVYLKRNWVLSTFFLSLPAALVSRLPVSFRKRNVVLVSSIAAGITLALGTIWLPEIHYRHSGSELEFDLRRPPINSKTITNSVSDPELWLYHNESTVTPDGQVVSHMSWRMHLWKQAWTGVKHSPIIGNGFGPRMFDTVLNGKSAMSEGRWISGPHNSFLTVLFRMGTLGLIPLISMLGLALLKSMRPIFSFEKLAFPAAMASLFYYALFNVCLENPHFGSWFWIFLGICAA